MVIDSMFVYYFVDPDLRVEHSSKKIEQEKMGGGERVDLEIGDTTTSVHLYWRLYCLSAFLLFFW